MYSASAVLLVGIEKEQKYYIEYMVTPGNTPFNNGGGEQPRLVHGREGLPPLAA